MNAAYASALAALAGTVIGALTSFATTWLTHRTQVRVQRTVFRMQRLEDLYRDFVEEASKYYADSLVHSTPDVTQLIKLYALICRMRVISTPNIVELAEAVARGIVDTYEAPNKSFSELNEMAHTGRLDPLREFSLACREQLNELGVA